MDVKQKYNQDTDGLSQLELESVGDKMPNWEPVAENRGSLRALDTQPTSTLSRIKCERYIFIKKCVCSFIEVRHYCWLCFRIYLYMYVAIQHQGSIPGRVIKTQKIVLDAALLCNQHYTVWIKGVKWSNPGKGVAPFPTTRCSSYWKGSLRFTLDWDRQILLFTLPIKSIVILIALI